MLIASLLSRCVSEVSPVGEPDSGSVAELQDAHIAEEGSRGHRRLPEHIQVRSTSQTS